MWSRSCARPRRRPSPARWCRSTAASPGSAHPPAERRLPRMKVSAAVLWGVGEPWSVEEVELDGPRGKEVLVRLAASGLCHSDEHLVTGDLPVPGFPYIGGHEGAGEVVEVGPGVHGLAPGDHVVLGFIPS